MTFNYEGLTPEHFSASINWITKMSAPTKWNLTDEEAAILLGMNVDEYVEIQEMAREGLSFSLRGESIERISLMLGIWKRLQLLGLDENKASLMFDKPNGSKLMEGKSIKQFLLERNSMVAFYAVNLYLENN